jgi:hypothetical protein
MKRKFIFPALMLCLGILNGCGATRMGGAAFGND